MNAFFEIFTGPGFTIVRQGVAFIAAWWSLWLPIVLGIGFWKLWVGYVRAQYIAQMEWVFLDVRLPEDIFRSPLAMELVLNSLQMGFGEAQAIEKYWKGGVRPWTSLELVSIEGDVHFIVRIVKGSRGLFESQIYSQYPDAEIHEIDDYTQQALFDGEEVKLWGAEFKLTKADPYPIKTYIDYGLDKNPKEEEKIDPITPTLEWLGSLGKGEQGWIQIVVRQHKKEDKETVGPFRKILGFEKGKPKLFPTKDSWKDDVKKEIDKIVKDRKITKEGDEDGGGQVNLTTVEKDVITALERSISKAAFDTGVRGIYMAEKDVFNPANIGGLVGSFRQYSTNHLNGFKPTNTTGVKYPWQDPFGKRVPRMKQMMLDAYRRRSYFHPPYKRKHFILNTEELATIYHFPGRVATTPTVKRLPSRKAEPPQGLPM